MSILNRLATNRHLDDAALADLWASSTLDGAAPSHPHLDACAVCRDRLTAFYEWADTLRDEACAEADAVFTPERLAAQQAHIMRRLEAAERPARVIAFPRFAQPLASRQSSVRRWIPVAAAAGLIVGLGVGQFMDLRQALGGGSAAAVNARNTTAESPLQPGYQTAAADDEAFMFELENAIARSTPEELVALDAVTPRARFTVDQPR